MNTLISFPLPLSERREISSFVFLNTHTPPPTYTQKRRSKLLDKMQEHPLDVLVKEDFFECINIEALSRGMSCEYIQEHPNGVYYKGSLFNWNILGLCVNSNITEDILWYHIEKYQEDEYYHIRQVLGALTAENRFSEKFIYKCYNRFDVDVSIWTRIKIDENIDLRYLKQGKYNTSSYFDIQIEVLCMKELSSHKGLTPKIILDNSSGIINYDPYNDSYNVGWDPVGIIRNLSIPLSFFLEYPEGIPLPRPPRTTYPIHEVGYCCIV